MKKAFGLWRIHLTTECPYCEEYQDIFDELSNQELHNTLSIGESKKLDVRENCEDLVICCENCQKEFAIKEVEY